MDLPPYTTTTRTIVPSLLLFREDCLSQFYPLRLLLGRIWKVQFRGGQGAQCPPGLIIIARVVHLTLGHEVVPRTCLGEDGPGDGVDVLGVTCHGPVLDHGSQRVPLCHHSEARR